MKIKILGKKELYNLVARDDNGIEFTADLIDAGNLPHWLDGTILMSEDDFNWWAQYIISDRLIKSNARQLAEDTGMDYADIMMEIGKAQANTDYDGHRAAAVLVMDSYRS